MNPNYPTSPAQIKWLCRRIRTTNKAHVWLGKDTACRMWSTGGMGDRSAWKVCAERFNDEAICSLCQDAMNRRPE
jgi:hypothetical protein